jgi:hypothetical protein
MSNVVRDTEPSSGAKNIKWPTIALLIVTGSAAVAANVIAIRAAASMRFFPVGASVRPMGVALAMAEGALLGIVVGLPLSLVLIYQCRRNRLVVFVAAISVALSISPFFLARAVYRFYVDQQRLIEEP